MTRDHPDNRARLSAAARRAPLSAALTLSTAIAAIACIHLGSGGIQYVEAGSEPVQARPTAALEFAPLTHAVELKSAQAPGQTRTFF